MISIVENQSIRFAFPNGYQLAVSIGTRNECARKDDNAGFFGPSTYIESANAQVSVTVTDTCQIIFLPENPADLTQEFVAGNRDPNEPKAAFSRGYQNSTMVLEWMQAVKSLHDLPL